MKHPKNGNIWMLQFTVSVQKSIDHCKISFERFESLADKRTILTQFLDSQWTLIRAKIDFILIKTYIYLIRNNRAHSCPRALYNAQIY